MGTRTRTHPRPFSAAARRTRNHPVCGHAAPGNAVAGPSCPLPLVRCWPPPIALVELSAKRQFRAELGRLRYDWRSQRSRCLAAISPGGVRAAALAGTSNAQTIANLKQDTPALLLKFAARKFARSMIIAHCCVGSWLLSRIELQRGLAKFWG
jgi:hypothetical protein